MNVTVTKVEPPPTAVRYSVLLSDLTVEQFKMLTEIAGLNVTIPKVVAEMGTWSRSNVMGLLETLQRALLNGR